MPNAVDDARSHLRPRLASAFRRKISRAPHAMTAPAPPQSTVTWLPARSWHHFVAGGCVQSPCAVARTLIFACCFTSLRGSPSLPTPSRHMLRMLACSQTRGHVRRHNHVAIRRRKNETAIVHVRPHGRCLDIWQRCCSRKTHGQPSLQLCRDSAHITVRGSVLCFWRAR